MISGMNKTTIIGLYNAGSSARSIAKQLSISRNTVSKYIKRYLKEKQALAETLDPVAAAKIQQEMLSKNRMDVTGRNARKFGGDIEQRFNELIAINEQRNKDLGPNKQEINGAIIYRQLKREGFDIGESTIRRKWSQYRAKQAEVFIKQSYEYGERADFDFHEVKLFIDGEKRIYHQATISCLKSNFIFIRLMPDETRKSVLTSLIEFFRYCGGVFKEITFDNMKPVVTTYGYKNNKILSNEIVKFATYYGFKINTTNGRKGNEKGHVENSGKLMRKELFSFNYNFINEAELFAFVDQEMEIANKGNIANFNEEKLHLKPLPIHDYNLGIFKLGKVNSYSFVRVLTNHYSVPEAYVYKEVRYSIISDLVVFYYGNHEIARHYRLKGKDSYQVNVKHYLKTLIKKPGAVARSLALRSADKEIIELFEKKYQDNPRGFIEYLYSEKSEKTHEKTTIESVANHQLGNINKTFNLSGANV